VLLERLGKIGRSVLEEEMKADAPGKGNKLSSYARVV
jgi:hypothetical protein